MKSKGFNKSILFILFLCFISVKALSQHFPPKDDIYADSIERKLHSALADSSKSKLYFLLSSHYYNTGEYLSALKCANTGIAFADSVRGIENLRTKGQLEVILADMYNIAIGDVGDAFTRGGQALAIADSLKDSALKAHALTEIGIACGDEGKHDEAMADYVKALSLLKHPYNEKQKASIESLIGNIYLFTGDTTNALHYYLLSINGYNAIHDEQGAVSSLNNIGCIYTKKQENDSALKYFEKVVGISLKTNNKLMIATALQNMGEVYMAFHQNNLALFYLNQADSVARSMEVPPSNMSDINEDICSIYMQKGDYPKAYYYSRVCDTLLRRFIDQGYWRKLGAAELKFEIKQEREKNKLEQEKKAAIAKEILKRQQFVKNTFVIAFLLAVLFAFYILNRLRLIRKQKSIIEGQKLEVDNAYKVIEEKNNEVLASIRYASRIQQSILPSEDIIHNIFPDSFVLWMPKDIVSGDFYWVSSKHDYRYALVADCTGHGVPGALMSMIGAQMFNEAINIKSLTGPAEILNDVRSGIISALRQKGDLGEQKDGMDAAFCALYKRDESNSVLEFAGANNSLWVIKHNATPEECFLEIRGNKHPIGIHGDVLTPFTLHKIDIQKGDTIYIFSDGYADQFGGPKGKKFKYSRLKDLVISLRNKSLNEQHELLRKNFLEWKGGLEQVDDICILVIRA